MSTTSTLVALATLTVSVPGAAAETAAESQAPEAPTVRVVVAGSAPFVLEQDGRMGGLAVDIFRLVAGRSDIRHKIDTATSVADAIRQVRTGQADIAVGPISITAARTASVTFTQPYYRARMGIVAPVHESGYFEKIRPFLTKAFGLGVGFLLLVLLGVGTLVWLIERRANQEQFSMAPVPGIGAGIWLALVTMTTVGYGDKAPITLAGRIVVGVWMVIAMITASSLTASIATALTLSQLDRAEIQGLADLAKRPVAFVSGTTSANIVQAAKGRGVGVATIPEAIRAVVDSDADAAVGDLPLLRYDLHLNPELPVRLVPVETIVENYGFAVAHGSKLLLPLDAGLLEAIENGEVAEAEQRYLAD
ncbi:MAG: transporter substrate-binding domain-containing protein [Deltaproteobacteria bacterium]